MPFRAGCVLLVLGVLALPAPAPASVALRADLPALTATADLVVRVRAAGEVSRWDSSRRRIYTDVTVVVQEVYKGDTRVGATLLVTRLGGSVGGIGMRVAGEVSLAAGEESILFLRRHEARRGGRLTVVGMAQGKLTVLRDRRGARVLPTAGGAGLRLVTPTAGGRIQRVATPPRSAPCATWSARSGRSSPPTSRPSVSRDRASPGPAAGRFRSSAEPDPALDSARREL